uniref:Rx_N domain-containing protein n=1 Tax=Haemonchus contortus TaxID=6289 RepID=A0A7I5EEN1_HAECO
MLYVLEARLTESRNKLQNMLKSWEKKPKKSEIVQRIGNTKNDDTKNESAEIDGDLAWLSEDMFDRSDNVQFDTDDAIYRTPKPSLLKMPRFYGD